jgi:TonB family protein
LGALALGGRSVAVMEDEAPTSRVTLIAPENTSPPPSAAQLAARAGAGDDGSSLSDEEGPDGERRAGARDADTADESSAESEARASANVLGSDARPDRVYRVLEVDDEAERDPDTGAPIYPEALQRRGIEGWVVTRFVIDTNGVVLPASLRIVSSTSSDFTRAVVEAMPTLRYRPALVNGRAVKQEAELTFRFRVERAMTWSSTAAYRP